MRQYWFRKPFALIEPEYYPNKSYHDACGPDVNFYHRRIDKSTPETKANCYKGIHVHTLNHCFAGYNNRGGFSTYFCKFCYTDMTLEVMGNRFGLYEYNKGDT